MIRIAAIVAAVMTVALFWHECGEDVGVFCYRIGMGAFAALRSRAMVAVPVTVNRLARTRTACLRPSGSSYTGYTTSRD